MWTVTAKPVSLGLFYWHRLVRVVPLYWIATVAMAVHQHADLAAIVKSGLFIPYKGEANRIWPVLVQGWTLNYEMVFYLVIGISLTLPRRIGGGLVGLTIVAASLAHYLFHSDNPVFLTYTNPIALEFVAGIAIAEMRLKGVHLTVAFSIASIVAGCLWFGLTAPRSLPEDSRVILWGIPSAFIVLGAVSFEAQKTVVRIRIALMLGNASFSVYLFYPFTLRTITHLLNGQNTMVSSLVSVVVVSVFGLLIHGSVEKPLTWAVQRSPRWFLRQDGGWSSVLSRDKA